MRQDTADQIIGSISLRGFWKGDAEGSIVGTCLLLAFDDVSLNDPRIGDTEAESDEADIADAIRTMFPERLVDVRNNFPSSAMIKFNDHPDTTEADVAAVVRACVN